jgi:hypothetical protein|tara:strand:- start:4538 stop:4822 length:285 start_codon:yes stop_codon:yes gene_type:complete
MKYKFQKDYFIDNENDAVILLGKYSYQVSFNSILSQKVLSMLFKLDKPYVIIEGEEEVVVIQPKPKSKTKKKKVKIDEPKKESNAITESNEEES